MVELLVIIALVLLGLFGLRVLIFGRGVQKAFDRKLRPPPPAPVHRRTTLDDINSRRAALKRPPIRYEDYRRMEASNRGDSNDLLLALLMFRGYNEPLGPFGPYDGGGGTFGGAGASGSWVADLGARDGITEIIVAPAEPTCTHTNAAADVTATVDTSSSYSADTSSCDTGGGL